MACAGWRGRFASGSLADRRADCLVGRRTTPFPRFIRPLTTEAYVQAYVVQIAPQVAERVVRVHVREGEQRQGEGPAVRAGPGPVRAEGGLPRSQARRDRASGASSSRRTWPPPGPTTNGCRPMPITPPRSTSRSNRSSRPNSTTERRYLEAVQKNEGEPGGRPPGGQCRATHRGRAERPHLRGACPRRAR